MDGGWSHVRGLALAVTFASIACLACATSAPSVSKEALAEQRGMECERILGLASADLSEGRIDQAATKAAEAERVLGDPAIAAYPDRSLLRSDLARLREEIARAREASAAAEAERKAKEQEEAAKASLVRAFRDGPAAAYLEGLAILEKSSAERDATKRLKMYAAARDKLRACKAGGEEQLAASPEIGEAPLGLPDPALSPTAVVSACADRLRMFDKPFGAKPAARDEEMPEGEGEAEKTPKKKVKKRR